MFAAGFQDNEVGKVLGASDNTGAGGANNWGYDEFLKNARKVPKTPFKPLPKDTGLNLAIRRSIRVGQKEGRPLEELGIKPDRRYYMTKRDLKGHNEDLVAEAACILSKKPVYSLSVKDNRRSIEISATSTTRRSDARKKIFRIDVLVSGWPYKSFRARNGALGTTTVTFEKVKPDTIMVQAFDHNHDLVAAYRNK